MEIVMKQMFGMLAQAAQGGQQTPAGGAMGMLLWMLPIFGLMYFLMWRPQAKKQKEHDEMLTRIKAGDQVMTTCGIFAKVVRVSDKKVYLEVAPNVKLEFALAAVAEVIQPEEDKDKPKEAQAAK